MQDSGARGEGEGTLGRPDVGTAVELIEHVQAWEANKLHVGTGCGLPLSRPCAGIVANARLGGRNGAGQARDTDPGGDLLSAPQRPI